MAWVKGGTTSVGNRERAASARAGLKNLILTWAPAPKPMRTNGYPASAREQVGRGKQTSWVVSMRCQSG
jgi:hypothetical protein